MGDPGRLAGAKYFHHDGYDEYYNFSQSQWAGAPSYSGLKVYVADGAEREGLWMQSGGSHASYISHGDRCTLATNIYVGSLCWCSEDVSGGTPAVPILRPLWELGDVRAPAWLAWSTGWPGYSDFFPGEGHTYPPAGPAFGDHAADWADGSFTDLLKCGEVVYNPRNTSTPYVQTFTNYFNGSPVIGGIRLTFDYTNADPVNDRPIVLRKDWNAVTHDTTDWRCVADNLAYGALEHIDSVGMSANLISYMYKVHYFHRSSNPWYSGCSLMPAYNTNSGWIFCKYCRPVPVVLDSCTNCVLRFHDSQSLEPADSFWVFRNIAGADTATYEGTVLNLGHTAAGQMRLQHCLAGDYYVVSISNYGNSISALYHFDPVCTTCGDANSDGRINISDQVFIVAYIYANGTPPGPCNYAFGKGDANGDGIVNISDAVYLVAYIFQNGPAPHCLGL